MLSEEEKEAIERLEKRIKDNEDYKTTQVWLTDDVVATQVVLSLIKENQIETEIYKEELDSIYKALDIERGVARPRTYEIIQVLKNTIKSQAKQIENTKALYDRALSDLVKADKQIDLMAKRLNQAYFDEDKFCKWFEKMMGVQQRMDYGYVVDLIKQYFAGLVEKE